MSIINTVGGGGQGLGGGQIEYIVYSGRPGHNVYYDGGDVWLFFSWDGTICRVTFVDASTLEVTFKSMFLYSNANGNPAGGIVYKSDTIPNQFAIYFSRNYNGAYYYKIEFNSDGEIISQSGSTRTDPGIGGYTLLVSGTTLIEGKTLTQESGKLLFVDSNLFI